MNIRKVLGYAALLLAGLFLIVATANAQTFSNNSPVAVNLTIGESLTVSATPSSINLINYSLANGSAQADNPITVTTTANLNSGHTWFFTSAYFSSATAALSGPGNVPSSDLFAAINGAAATPCTSAPGGQVIPGVVAGAVCASPSGNNPSLGAISSRQNPSPGFLNQVDTFVLSMSGAMNLQPGTYSGVLTFVAGAF